MRVGAAHLRRPLRQENGGGVRDGVGVGVEVRVEVRVEGDVGLEGGVGVEAWVRVDVGCRDGEAAAVSVRCGEWVVEGAGLALVVDRGVRSALALVLGHWVARVERENDGAVECDEEGLDEGEREGRRVTEGVLVPRTCTAPEKPMPAGPDTLLQSAPARQGPEQAEVVKPIVLP